MFTLTTIRERQHIYRFDDDRLLRLSMHKGHPFPPFPTPLRHPPLFGGLTLSLFRAFVVFQGWHQARCFLVFLIWTGQSHCTQAPVLLLLYPSL